MPGSTVPESIPLCVVRLSDDELDALSRWFGTVMRCAQVPDQLRRNILSILIDIEHDIRLARAS